MHWDDHPGPQALHQRVGLLVGQQVLGVVHRHQQHVDVADGVGDIVRPFGAVVADMQEADAARFQPEHHVGEIAQAGGAGVQISNTADVQVFSGKRTGHSQD